MVLMHGVGSNELDMLGLAQELHPKYEIICPRAPKPYGPGFAWYSIAWTAEGFSYDHDEYLDAVADLAAFVGEVKPLVVGGFSQGSIMTIGLMTHHVEVIPNAVILSGRGLNQKPSTFPGHVFQAHGQMDEVLPLAEGHAVRTALVPLGERFEYHEYPIGHSVSREEIDDLNRWLAARLD